MSTTQVIKPGKGDKVYRMSDEKFQDKDGNDLENTSGNIVKFKVQYPKDHKGGTITGKPYFGLKNESVHELHVVHAKVLEDKGLGKIEK